ncbi:nucleoside diphosphate kinase regulator [Aliiroseovarius zhejiangensis]|uniref:Nucleoside diphosphate kinase regulator n=1 Tax=Aliiroseovarius zhejiangensis TaxID=1632025 RepID=A0ABQ3IRW9_9RHOB|nr:nucleoside diphosphate kinase regulator [Aliiroseovarius zhejiangensis]GHE89914.1 nucleoside diphosphate kinase regulator [Aliiroseovarius zhejiangensis]
MSTSIQTPKTSRNRNPKIVINADDIMHLEGLVDGMMRRHPALADRLLDEISRARIVSPSKMPKDVVGIGSTVTYRDESTRQNKTVTLVYPEDADISQFRVSVMTPIGVALLGLAEGTSFYWDTRENQRRTLTIISVEQPESTYAKDLT